MLADDRTYYRDTTGDGSTVSGALRQGAPMTDLEAIAARLAKALHDEGLFHGPAASGYRDERVIHKAASYILADARGDGAIHPAYGTGTRGLPARHRANRRCPRRPGAGEGDDVVLTVLIVIGLWLLVVLVMDWIYANTHDERQKPLS
jgi:hypothetical protein